MSKCKCGKELKNVGFVKNDDGVLLYENYTCENMDCPKFRATQSLPTSTIEVNKDA